MNGGVDWTEQQQQQQQLRQQQQQQRFHHEHQQQHGGGFHRPFPPQVQVLLNGLVTWKISLILAPLKIV